MFEASGPGCDFCGNGSLCGGLGTATVVLNANSGNLFSL